jgi:hypothetical protein
MGEIMSDAIQTLRPLPPGLPDCRKPKQDEATQTDAAGFADLLHAQAVGQAPFEMEGSAPSLLGPLIDAPPSKQALAEYPGPSPKEHPQLARAAKILRPTYRHTPHTAPPADLIGDTTTAGAARAPAGPVSGDHAAGLDAAPTLRPDGRRPARIARHEGPMPDGASEQSRTLPELAGSDAPPAPGDGRTRAANLRLMRLVAQTRASPVMVTLQAVDAGVRVYARVGAMEAGERQRLRTAVRALLAEHGLHEAEFIVDVRDAASAGPQENGA